ncbi:MAG: hypothetical protein PUF37_04325 [Prevotellaceae bacterium]|nr:hypothetical protein [Prevotellaceae bacterium]
MKKVLFGLVAIVVCMVTVFTMSSCSKTGAIKSAVEKINQGTPKETAGGTTLTKVEFDEATNTVTYNYEVAPEAFASVQQLNALDGYKEYFMNSIKDDASIKELAKLLVDVKGAVKYVYTPKGGSDKVEITLATADLQNLLDNKIDQTKIKACEEAMQQLQAAAQQQQQQQTEESVDGTEESGSEEESTGEEEGSEEGGSEEESGEE